MNATHTPRLAQPSDPTATTEDAPRVVGDAIRQRLSWASLHWNLNDPDDEGWGHIVAAVFHALAAAGLLATARPDTTTEWAVRSEWTPTTHRFDHEHDARAFAAHIEGRVLIRREVTTWTEADR